MAVHLAVPTLGLGVVALILAVAIRQAWPSLVSPLHSLTLAYAVLALALRSTTATAWTGWLVVGAALLLLEVGRRNQQAELRWLALLGLSLGWYELVIYQLLQADGGSPVDGVIVLAGVAALIMAVYRLAANRLDRHLHLPQADLIWAAHSHWLVGSVLMLGGRNRACPFTDADLAWGGVAIATALLLYALLQGRTGDHSRLKSAWVYGGLVELVGWFALLRFTVPTLAFFGCLVGSRRLCRRRSGLLDSLVPAGLAPAALAGHGGGRPPGNHRADRRVRPHPYPVDSGRVLRLAGLAQSPLSRSLTYRPSALCGQFGSG